MTETFYKQHEDWVRRYVAARVPLDDVEDVAGSVWEKALRHMTEANEPARLLNRIARSVVADYHRRRAVRTRNTVFLSQCNENDAIDAIDLLDGLIVNARIARVRAVLNGYAPAKRERVASAIAAVGERTLTGAERTILKRFRRTLAGEGDTI